MFADRDDAAQQILDRLPTVDPANTVVLALPRGGVPIGAVVALARKLPLDLLLVRKVGAPGHPELAVGAVTEDITADDASAGSRMQLWVNPDVARGYGLDEAAVRRLAENELPELRRRRAAYLGERPAPSVAGKTVIVVDDGVATGATMRAALRLLKQSRPQRVILAVPVAPADVLHDLAAEADEIICILTPEPFVAVGLHYAAFSQVSDDEVIALLREVQDAPGVTD